MLRGEFWDECAVGCGLGEVGGNWYRTEREGDGMATNTQICAMVSSCSSGGGEDGSGRGQGGDGCSSLGEEESSDRGVFKSSPLHTPFDSGKVESVLEPVLASSLAY